MPSSKLLKWRYFTKTEALHRDIFCYECAQFCKSVRSVKFVESVGSEKDVEAVEIRGAPFSVIPRLDRGIQENQGVLDSRLRGSDGFGEFLRFHQD